MGSFLLFVQRYNTLSPFRSARSGSFAINNVASFRGIMLDLLAAMERRRHVCVCRVRKFRGAVVAPTTREALPAHRLFFVLKGLVA